MRIEKKEVTIDSKYKGLQENTVNSYMPTNLEKINKFLETYNLLRQSKMNQKKTDEAQIKQKRKTIKIRA